MFSQAIKSIYKTMDKFTLLVDSVCSPPKGVGRLASSDTGVIRDRSLGGGLSTFGLISVSSIDSMFFGEGVTSLPGKK